MRDFLDRSIHVKWRDCEVRVIDIVMLIVITLSALLVRIYLIDITSRDYNEAIIKWIHAIEENGGIRSLGKVIGNYPPAYIMILTVLTYLPGEMIVKIKIINYVFELFAAFMAANCISKGKSVSQRILLFTLILVSPTVIANGSIFVQCDMMYVAFVLMALYGVLENRYTLSFIGLGFAFAFKSQTVFIVPLYALLWFEGKYKIRKIVWIPAIYCAFAVIPVLYGRGFKEILKIYIGQVGQFSTSLTMQFPNIYALTGDAFASEFVGAGVFFTFIILCCVMYYIYNKKIEYDGTLIVELALFFILIMVYFLPLMHERYAIMADVISIIFIFFNKKKFYIAITINMISFLSYEPYLMGYSMVSQVILSVVLFICIIDLGRNLYMNVNANKKSYEI